MLKYFSWILIILALSASWWMTYSEPVVGMEVHATIQREVGDMIRNYIQEQRPAAHDIRFEKLYTQTISPTQVRAIFKYSFVDNVGDDDESEQTFEGQATLNKDTKSSADESVWTLDEVSADNKALVFKKGIEIHPGESPEPPPDGEPDMKSRPATPTPEEQNG